MKYASSLILVALLYHWPGAEKCSGEDVKRVAAIVTEYRHNSHADLIVSRLFQTDTLDAKGPKRRLKLVSLYMDQTPPGEKGHALAETYGFTVCPSVADALTLGTNRLAVDAVLLIAEHGAYPRSDTGQTVYPKRRLFEQVVAVFRRTGQVAPVFIDKHLADNWADASWIYETSRALGIPLMAGSSLPVAWRYPADDVLTERRLKEMLVLSYHTLDGYGFHALEIAQALAEARLGGESGVARVRCVQGADVWKRLNNRKVDPDLLNHAIAVLRNKPARGRSLPDLVKEPTLFQVTYVDGLTVQILTLNGAVGEWSGAWRYEGDSTVHASLFYTQEARPFMHFTYLVRGIETFFLTGKPAWPVERTLLTSGVLDRLLISRKDAGRAIETPELRVSYQSSWRWSQPPPPPRDRPLDGP